MTVSVQCITGSTSTASSEHEHQRQANYFIQVREIDCVGVWFDRFVPVRHDLLGSIVFFVCA